MSVEQNVLEAKTRDTRGKGPARRLRMTGFVPAVVYGRDSKAEALAIDPLGLRKAIANPHRLNTVITVKLAGSPDRLVLLKDVQQHPLTRAIEHADFIEVRLDRHVKVEVPVVLTGRAAGQAEGGILTQVNRTITVLCLPGVIPLNLPIDVTNMKIGGSLHESDLKLPEGIKLAGKTNATLVVLAVPQEEVVVAAVVEPVPGAAPAAGAPGAPGAAPAAAGAAPAAGAKGAAPAAAGAKGAAPAAAGGKAASAPAAKPGGKK